jgi:hypothetical protein
MIRVRRLLICLIPFCSTLLSYGCVVSFAAGATTGAGQYAIDSIANRASVGSLNHVTPVFINVLNQMKIQIDTVKNTKIAPKFMHPQTC